MRIERLELNHFGKFDRLDLSFKPGVNILYGPNEAGKSTLREAFKVLLFGFGKAPQNYGYRSWNGAALKLRATFLMEDGAEIEVERVLGKNAEGRIFRGTLSEMIGNQPMPDLQHLSRELYGQIYALSTVDTRIFQELDWEGAVRKMLMSSGTELLKPTDEVLQQLEQEGSKLIRLNGRGNYLLKDLEVSARELEDKRRTLLKQREDLTGLILKDQTLKEQLNGKTARRHQMRSDLAAFEAFTETWMLMKLPEASGIEVENEWNYKEKDYVKVLSIMEDAETLGRDLDERLRGWHSDLKSILEEKRALFGGDEASSESIGLKELETLTAERGEQAQLLAREGRQAKAKDRGMGMGRMLLGLGFLFVGAAAVVIPLGQNNMVTYALAAAFGAAGLLFSAEGLINHWSGHKKRISVEKALQEVFSGLLPGAALTTLDESYFERVKNLCRSSSRLLIQKAELDQLKDDVGELLDQLDRLGECPDGQMHQLGNLGALKTKVIHLQKGAEQRIQRQAHLAETLARAESSSGWTTEILLQKLKDYEVSALPQGIEKLKAVLEMLDNELQGLHAEAASIQREVELKSSLEELPRIEAALIGVQQEMATIRRERDRLHVLETFIRMIDQRYAKAHQPQLIQMASSYFSALTKGRYEQIYMSDLHEQGSAVQQKLHLDTASGTQSLEKLTSTGTREQLHFALKLSVATQIESGRASLPLILDEVFAHWDEERIVKALELIKAEGDQRQIFLFTCRRELAKQAEIVMGSPMIELV